MTLTRLNAHIILLLATLTVAGCAPRGTILRESSDSVATGVLVGRMPKITSDAPYSVSDRIYRVAAANTPQGEPLLFDPDENVRQAEVSWAFGVGGSVLPAARYTVRGGRRGLTLRDATADMLGRHGNFLFIRGGGRFKSLRRRENDILVHKGGDARFAGAVITGRSKATGAKSGVFRLGEEHRPAAGQIFELRAESDGVMIDLSPQSELASGWIEVYVISAVDER